MGTATVIINVLFIISGLAVSLCCAFPRSKRLAESASNRECRVWCLSSLLPLTGGILGLVWCLGSPPLFSQEITGPPHTFRNDPSRSIYLGNGCFWHTQYDTAVVEQNQNGSFGGRSNENITSLVGYAGGRYQSSDGTACYHGMPHTDYGKLGHAEAVSITLDSITGATARAQVSELAAMYFEHGFQTVGGGKRQRLDPMDQGAEYRNVIGLPGGKHNAELWPLFEAANQYGMPLVTGTGGTRDDTEDEYVVYIYDSLKFPFFRGEAYHQFHANTVIGRPVPRSYTGKLKDVQESIGRLDSTGCTEIPSEISFLFSFCFSVLTGLGLAACCGFAPARLHFWEKWTEARAEWVEPYATNEQSAIRDP